MEEPKIIQPTEEEIWVVNEFVDNHSVLEVLVACFPKISTYFEKYYFLRRQSIDNTLSVTPDEEAKEKLIRRELKKESKIFKLEQIRVWLANFDLPLLQFVEVGSSFQAFQKAGMRFTENDLNLEFEITDEHKVLLVAILNGEKTDLPTTNQKEYLLKLIEHLPIEIRSIFNDPENFNFRLLNFLIDTHFKKLYLKDLVDWLEEGEDTETDYFLSCNVRWNGSKVDLIRLLVAAYDCKLFKPVDGEILSLDLIMTEFGRILDTDLSNHSNDLSNGLDKEIETNRKIFEDMKRKIEARHSKKAKK